MADFDPTSYYIGLLAGMTTYHCLRYVIVGNVKGIEVITSFYWMSFGYWIYHLASTG